MKFEKRFCSLLVHEIQRVALSTSALQFLHLNFNNDDIHASGHESVTPIRRNDIPLVGHWCMKQLSIDNVSQSRGGYIRGCIRERAVVITQNCVKFKFLFPRPRGLASWSFEPWRLAKEDVFKRCAKRHF